MILPNGQNVQLEVESTRTAKEVAEVITRKVCLAIPSGHTPELYMLSTGETLAGTAKDLCNVFAGGNKIGLRVVNVPPPLPPPQVSISEPSQQVFLGKKRNPCAPLFLPLITLGIYNLVWIYKLFNEARLYANNRNGTKITSGGAAVGFLFIPVFNIIWGIMLWFKIPGLVTRMRQADGLTADQRGSTGALGFLMLIPLVGGILWLVLTQNAINSFWKESRQRHGSVSVIHDASRPKTGCLTLFIILLIFLIAGAVAGVILYQQGQLPLPVQTEYGIKWKTQHRMEREQLRKQELQRETEQPVEVKLVYSKNEEAFNVPFPGWKEVEQAKTENTQPVDEQVKSETGYSPNKKDSNQVVNLQKYIADGLAFLKRRQWQQAAQEFSSAYSLSSESEASKYLELAQKYINAGLGDIVWSVSVIVPYQAKWARPIVEQGQVIVCCTEAIEAYDSIVGTKTWRSELGSYPDSEIGVYGHLLILRTKDQVLWCLDVKTGVVQWRWKKPGKSYLYEDEGYREIIIVGDRVIENCDGKLYVLDIQAGRVVGILEVQDEKINCLPLTLSNKTFLAAWEHVYLVDYDLAKMIGNRKVKRGEEQDQHKLWWHWTRNLCNSNCGLSTNPVYSDGNVFFRSKLTMCSISVNTGELNWTAYAGKGTWVDDIGRLAVYNDKLYEALCRDFQGKRTTYICCFDCFTGKSIWETPLPDCHPGYAPDLLPDIGDKYLLARGGSIDGKDRYLYILDAVTGKLLKTITFDFYDYIAILGTAQSNDAIYLLAKNQLLCIAAP